MYRRLLPTLALTSLLSFAASTPLWAQQGTGEDAGSASQPDESGSEQSDSEQSDSEQPDSEQPDSEQSDSEQPDSEQSGSEQSGSEQAAAAPAQDSPAISQDDLPASPKARVERAERAFEDADFEMIRPLLEPLLLPDSTLDDEQLEFSARTLLGVGYYFEAQQVTDATTRRELLDQAETQFLARLRAEPDRPLNPMIYPASVVEFFETVMDEHAEELDAIRTERDEAGRTETHGTLTTVYIEREVGLKNYAVNFMPFGVGQFQNDEPVQGTLFATAQGAALGLNVASYWIVESLRGQDGYYEPGTGQDADHARQWRVAQYVGLGAFVGLYVWSIIDALQRYEGQEIRIRTLDEPPPELRGGGEDDSGVSLQIGLGGIGVAW
ncbi:MAG: hypothetical protein ACLFVJ_08525 [Persicimonas sp.]